jgi:hypothetical protein
MTVGCLLSPAILLRCVHGIVPEIFTRSSYRRSAVIARRVVYLERPREGIGLWAKLPRSLMDLQRKGQKVFIVLIENHDVDSYDVTSTYLEVTS